MLNVENGEVSCTKSSLVGSLCNVTCHPNYLLVGKETSLVCNPKAKWSSKPPRCISKSQQLVFTIYLKNLYFQLVINYQMLKMEK